MPPAKKAPFSVACFGEILWDILPRGIFLGGAPINAVYHLTRLGVSAWPISAVGRDFLGDEALRRIRGWPADASLIHRHRDLPTGIVRATLDAHGAAKYQIAERVAWDRIEVPKISRTSAPGALVFGSLALRNRFNRGALGKLADVWPATLRVLDLNLRPPFDRGKGVAFALAHAQLVKLNDDELARQTGASLRTPRAIERAAREFAAQQRVARICVTAGARGAGVLWAGRWCWEKGRAVDVRDTVGAGDAFLAGFLAAHFSRRDPIDAALASACRLGEFVAACDGAMPLYRIDPYGQPTPP